MKMLKEKTIDQLIRETWMQITKLYNEEAAKYEGTMSVGYVLLKIDPVLGAPSTSLAPKLGMEPTSLSRTLKKMEEKGLIYREPNPEDGRSVLIKLTDLGLKMRDKSKETVLRFNEVLNENIPKEDLDIFKKVSNTILTLINDNKIF
jgi:DNA-binding MarR family transcriptional regulator